MVPSANSRVNAPARVRAGREFGGVGHAVAVGVARRAVVAGRERRVEAELDLPRVREPVTVPVAGLSDRRRCEEEGE